MTETIAQKAIKRLIERRKKLQASYDALINEPAAYGITGSVNATNQKLADLRLELAALDNRIAALINGRTSVAGMSISLPDYRHWPEGI